MNALILVLVRGVQRPYRSNTRKLAFLFCASVPLFSNKYIEQSFIQNKCSLVYTHVDVK